MSSEPSPWEVYRKALVSLKFGDALWEPSPIYSYDRVQLGDVGYIREGRFHLLFSAGIPLGERVLGTDVPSTFEQLNVGPIIVGQARPPGFLRSSTVKQSGAKISGSCVVACDVGPGAKMSFKLTNKQGAALITNYPTHREDIERKLAFENYAKQHYDSWVDFAYQTQHGDDIRPILVTGVQMTRQFAMVAYAERQTDMECNFSVGDPSVGSASLSVWGSWQAQGLVHTSCGPSEIPEEYNQCVFIRYYTIIRKDDFASRLRMTWQKLGTKMFSSANAQSARRPGVGPHELPDGNTGRDGTDELPDGNTGSGGTEEVEAGSPDSDDELVVVGCAESSPNLIHNVPLDDRDDFDVVAEFIFQRTNATSVLLHHRDIEEFTLESEKESIRQMEESAVVERVEIDENGVARIVGSGAKDTGYENRPTAKGANDVRRGTGPHTLRAVYNLAPAWKRLIDRPLTPDERMALIEEHFADRNETAEVMNLSGDKAQSFIDVIDETLDILPPWLRRLCLKSLCKICGHKALLPRSMQIPLSRDSLGSPQFYDGFSEVRKGQHQGYEVAVKALSVYETSNFDKIRHRFCKEVLTWRALCHPSVLPLLGVTMGDNRFMMVSEWMTNGDINRFVKAHRDVNRLELLADVAQGLIYLHDEGIIHGDLKGANILIDNCGHVRLADFGLVTITSDPSYPTTSNQTGAGGTTRWMSPELLGPAQPGPGSGRPTKESDRYAMGMVIYEVLSGHAPLAQYTNHIVSSKIIGGERPGRPSGAEGASFTDDLWQILEKCWSAQPQVRPTTELVLEYLERASKNWQPLPPGAAEDTVDDNKSVSTVTYSSILHGSDRHLVSSRSSSPTTEDTSVITTHDAHASASLRGIANWDGRSPGIIQVLTTAFKAGDYLDCVNNLRTLNINPMSYINKLDEITDGLSSDSDLWKQCIRELSRACGTYGVLPASHKIALTLAGPHGKPFNSNDFSSIWKFIGDKDHKKVFAIKSFQVSDLRPVEEFKKSFCREVVVFKRVSHPNILSIEGVVPGFSTFCVMSRWMANGNIMEYIAKHRKANRLELLIGVTHGLNYLHKNKVVHGSLKTSNVLVDAEGNARLSDFGLFSIRTAIAPNSRHDFGTRYSAPELLGTDDKKPTGKSDIYSLSMIIVELATGQTPFFGSSDSKVINMVLSDERPRKPRRFDAPGITAEVWNISEQCWHRRAIDRPRVKDVLQDLEGIASSGGEQSSLRRRLRIFR